MKLAGLRVGITIGPLCGNEASSANDVSQGAIFLAKALKYCANVASVTLLNTTSTRATDALNWDLDNLPITSFEAGKDQIDVLIELGGQISKEQTEHIKRQGVRFVSYCCSFEYVQMMESSLFGVPGPGFDLFVNTRYDDIWMAPQVAELNGSYFQTLRRKPPKVVPFIWDPMFIEQLTSDLPHGGRYTSRTGSRRISVMERNVSMMNFCLYPALIVDAAFRLRPDAISLLQVTNANRIATDSPEFISLMNYLDLVKAHKSIFIGSQVTPRFLAESSDIVVAHQWENPLSYFYLEVCWQGYPLIHNGHLCADLGYFYKDHNLEQGCKRLLEAIDTHDVEPELWRDEQRHLMKRFLPGHPEITARYTVLLDDLIEVRVV